MEADGEPPVPDPSAATEEIDLPGAAGQEPKVLLVVPVQGMDYRHSLRIGIPLDYTGRVRAALCVIVTLPAV
jgi:hypothetical protein